MKTETSTNKSATGCINQVIRYTTELHHLASRQKASFDGQRMQEVRDLAESILQAVHEYSAYQNVLAELG